MSPQETLNPNPPAALQVKVLVYQMLEMARANHCCIRPRKPLVMHIKRRKFNSVNGASSNDGTSLGTGNHGCRQMALERHHATACNTRAISVATGNVRSLYQAGKLENVKWEATRLGINILGMCEVRWKETVQLVKLKGKDTNISIVQRYTPTSLSTEEEIDQFYEEIDKAKEQYASQDIVIIMGDYNAKVGQQREGFAVGEHGLGLRNERGNKLADWCKANEQLITNTWFYHHPGRRWTWKSPDDNTRNQIDYITICRYSNAVKQSKSYPGADCGSGHVRENAVAVKNRFEFLEGEGQPIWEAFNVSLTETPKKMIPKKSKTAKGK
ncbi:craniofacial development protein 2-like [Penaeus chinensis]|uniref:craniofacial development protein 2-like n=1 Tax=Penaeus chinensis TaxID=139456 RepID=UPI001FB62986|nr:craniofacial development protein 2-like [Penaeus chinensis]